jgi:phosphatidylserine/phosphatidylglycerophosphate/cardiolipin synthase-like enzyme
MTVSPLAEMKRLPELQRHRRLKASILAALLAGSLQLVPIMQVSVQAKATAVESVRAVGTLQAAFTPWDNVEGIIVDAIGQARRQVLVQAYLLTNKKITAALVAAHRRRVDVRVLLDAGQLEKVSSSTAPLLAKAGIPVWLETKYQNAHNKVMVIDASTPEATVITGSFNYTWTAEHKNAENILVARNNPALAARYAGNWERHQQEAQAYRP